MKKLWTIFLIVILSYFIPAQTFTQSALGKPNTTIMVNTLADTINDSDGNCSLREAVIAANTDTASGSAIGECNAGNGIDTITLGIIGTYHLTIGGANEN